MEIEVIERRAVAGYEGEYEVDALGRVFSIDRVKRINDNGRIYDKKFKGRELKTFIKNGYKVVGLTHNGVDKKEYVHRIVAKSFIDNPHNFKMVNHKDENRLNNSIENLEWCTATYNIMYGEGCKRRSEKMRGRKLSDNHKDKISKALRKHYKAHPRRETEKIKQPMSFEERTKMNEHHLIDCILCPQCVYYYAPVCTFHKELYMTSRSGFCHHAVRGRYEGPTPTIKEKKDVRTD